MSCSLPSPNNNVIAQLECVPEESSTSNSSSSPSAVPPPVFNLSDSLKKTGGSQGGAEEAEDEFEKNATPSFSPNDNINKEEKKEKP